MKYKKYLTVFLLSMVLGTSLPLTNLSLSSNVYANTLTVSSTNPHDDFLIQLNNAQNGDTIELSSDVTISNYTDNTDPATKGKVPVLPFEFNKSVTIDGKGHTLTIRQTPIQLNADVTFKDIKLELPAGSGITLDVHNQEEKNQLIYLNGYSLTFDKVDTTMNPGAHKNSRPTIIAGKAVTSTAPSGPHAKFIATNSIEETVIKNIILGGFNGSPYSGPTHIELDNNVKVINTILSGERDDSAESSIVFDNAKFVNNVTLNENSTNTSLNIKNTTITMDNIKGITTLNVGDSLNTSTSNVVVNSPTTLKKLNIYNDSEIKFRDNTSIENASGTGRIDATIGKISINDVSTGLINLYLTTASNLDNFIDQKIFETANAIAESILKVQVDSRGYTVEQNSNEYTLRKAPLITQQDYRSAIADVYELDIIPLAEDYESVDTSNKKANVLSRYTDAKNKVEELYTRYEQDAQLSPAFNTFDTKTIDDLKAILKELEEARLEFLDAYSALQADTGEHAQVDTNPNVSVTPPPTGSGTVPTAPPAGGTVPTTPAPSGGGTGSAPASPTPSTPPIGSGSGSGTAPTTPPAGGTAPTAPAPSGGGGGGGGGSTPTKKEEVKPEVKDEVKPEVSTQNTDILAKVEIVAQNKSIEYLKEKKIMNGVSSDSFGENLSVTRSQLAQILLNVNKDNLQSRVKAVETLPFKDVDKNSWYYRAVNIGYSAGFFKGKSIDTFSPNDDISLGELSVFIYNLYSWDKINLDTKTSNVKNIVSWNKNAIVALNSKIDLEKLNLRDANSKVSRGQLAQIMSSLLLENNK